MRVRSIGLWALAMTPVVFLATSPVAWAQTSTAAPITAKIDGKYGYWLPPDLSQHGSQIDNLITILHWFMAALFVGWAIFLVRCLIRYRARPGHAACYDLIKARPAKAVEVAVVIVEIVLLAGFSIPAWAKVKNDLPTEADTIRVRVVAEQFAWNFHYPGKDGIFGRTGPQHVNPATNAVGIDLSDEHAGDDVQTKEFHVPSDKPVICEISSKDVIHSFSIPVLRVKQDAIPGMRIPVWFRMKPGSEGNYEVACAQLCGNNHYNMKALMVIETPEKFAAWLTKAGEKEIFED